MTPPDKKWTNSARRIEAPFCCAFGSFDLHFTEIHRVRFDRKPRNRLHLHTHFEPCLVVSGRGNFLHGGMNHRLRKGTLFVADPHVDHEITSLRTRDLDLLFLSFAVAEGKGSGATSAEETARGFLRSHSIACQAPELLSLFLAARQFGEASSPQLRRTLFPRLIAELILGIMQALQASAVGERKAGPTEGRDVVSLVTETIDASIGESLNVPEIARRCGLSERHLRRLYHQRTGRSVAAEILNRRMDKAARLLSRPEYSLTEIAEAVGIPDPSQFSRSFKKVHGITPKRFRQQPAGISSSVNPGFLQTRMLDGFD